MRTPLADLIRNFTQPLLLTTLLSPGAFAVRALDWARNLEEVNFAYQVKDTSGTSQILVADGPTEGFLSQALPTGSQSKILNGVSRLAYVHVYPGEEESFLQIVDPVSPIHGLLIGSRPSGGLILNPPKLIL